MHRLEFALDGHDYVELHQLLKLVGVVDSGGAGKHLVASGAVARGRRGGTAEDLQDPRGPGGPRGRRRDRRRSPERYWISVARTNASREIR